MLYVQAYRCLNAWISSKNHSAFLTDISGKHGSLDVDIGNEIRYSDSKALENNNMKKLILSFLTKTKLGLARQKTLICILKISRSASRHWLSKSFLIWRLIYYHRLLNKTQRSQRRVLLIPATKKGRAIIRKPGEANTRQVILLHLYRTE